VAAARIPIISAVGHETDTTLIDFVSDRRAPTPTGAAEIATPVLADLRYAVSDLESRLDRAGARLLDDRRTRLRAVARGLPARPEELVAIAQQRLDHAASRLASGLHRNAALHERRLAGAAGRLGRPLLDRALERRAARLEATAARLEAGLRGGVAVHERRLLQAAGRLTLEPLHRRLDQRRARLDAVAARLDAPLPRRVERAEDRLHALSRALASLDPRRPRPGFARIDDADGRMIASAALLAPGQDVSIVFPDGSRAARIESDLQVDGAEPEDRPRIPRTARPTPPPRSRPAGPTQGDLF